MTTLRDCDPPKRQGEMLHDQEETVTVKGVTVDCFRDDHNYYERFTYPNGRIRWLKLSAD